SSSSFLQWTMRWLVIGRLLGLGNVSLATFAEGVADDIDGGGDLDAILPAIIAVPNGHGLVLGGLAVDREAVGRADLVVASVAAADGVLLVELGVDAMLEEFVGDLARGLGHAVLAHK